MCLVSAAEKLVFCCRLCGGTDGEEQGDGEVQAWDTLDGILEIFAADDECLK